MEVDTIICLTVSHICFYELFLLRFFVVVVVFIPVSVKIKHGLRTDDHGLRTDDHGLRTWYKTRSRYKMRTVDYVSKKWANWF